MNPLSGNNAIIIGNVIWSYVCICKMLPPSITSFAIFDSSFIEFSVAPPPPPKWYPVIAGVLGNVLGNVPGSENPANDGVVAAGNIEEGATIDCFGLINAIIFPPK